MTRRILTVLFLGLLIAAVPGAVFADGVEFSGDQMVISEPIETGAVPEAKSSDALAASDTHHNPFHPELRVIDLGGGGE